MNDKPWTVSLAFKTFGATIIMVVWADSEFDAGTEAIKRFNRHLPLIDSQEEVFVVSITEGHAENAEK